MGRLQVVMLAVVACNDPGKSASGGRSEQVVSTAGTATLASVPSTPRVLDTPTPRGALCDRTPGRTLPKAGIAFVDATGAITDRQAPWSAKHGAVWLSFFASWCGPCKEEIPRIQRFVKRLGEDGVPVDLTYVSIDDDLRQLGAFLAQQPDSGIKSAFWLKDGAPRTAWLGPLKMAGDAPLPEHGFFDSKGKLRCWVSGALDEPDYAQIAASLR